jgi:hypothetical protein
LPGHKTPNEWLEGIVGLVHLGTFYRTKYNTCWFYNGIEKYLNQKETVRKKSSEEQAGAGVTRGRFLCNFIPPKMLSKHCGRESSLQHHFIYSSIIHSEKIGILRDEFKNVNSY